MNPPDPVLWSTVDLGPPASAGSVYRLFSAIEDPPNLGRSNLRQGHVQGG